MIYAWLRFYEELNDWIAPEKRKHTFRCGPMPAGTTASRVIEFHGVPVAEVDLVLCDGEPVELSHVLRGGERVSIFPVFEAFDISGVTRVRRMPLRQPRFAVCRTAPALVRYFRGLGFDALEWNIEGDRELGRAADEGRVLITCDPDFADTHGGAHAVVIEAGKPREQLVEVLDRLQLHRLVRPLGRCPACNHPLPASAGDAASAQVRCSACGRVRRGAHLRRLARAVEWALASRPRAS